MQRGAEPHLAQATRAHRGEVTCLDAAGASLVSAGADRSLRLWRWREGAGWVETATASTAHRYAITAVRWAPAGRLAASAGVDGVARLWGLALRPRRRLVAPGATAARSLCWAGGCARLLVGHDDGAVSAWCVCSGELVRRMRAHEGSVRALAVVARGALLLTACTEGVLKVFDLAEVCASGREGEDEPVALMREDGAHDLGVLCADGGEGGVAATGGRDGRVRRWAAVGRALAARGAPLEGHAGAVTAVRWAAGDVLLSAALDGSARVWAAAGTCVCVLHGHARYLTSLALDPELRYVITGSDDGAVRTWTAGGLALGAPLDPPCVALEHFALGDLQGVGPPDEPPASPDRPPGAGADVLRRAWAAERAHSGAVNCVAVQGALLATASSDGLVKVFRWDEARGELALEHELRAHGYPVMATDFGAGGRLLLSAGLDGRAQLWDVQSGVRLRALSLSGAEARGGESGGGGVRGARVSPHQPPLLLLATDDGLAPLWTLGAADPEPTHVYAGHTEAVTCCTWSSDGQLLATGAASGELRLFAPPPDPRMLHHEPHAHDLGVQSCEFASHLGSEECMLATGGADSLVKLWAASVRGLRLVRAFEAHGGGVTSVRWGAAALATAGADGWGVAASETAGAVGWGAAALATAGADGWGAAAPEMVRAGGWGAATLATAGADGWARAWRVLGDDAAVSACGAADVPGALSVALVSPEGVAMLLAVGTLGGGLSLWRLPVLGAEERVEAEEAEVAARLWGAEGVARWLREYVVRGGGGAALEERARRARLTGARLLDEPVERLLDLLGCGGVDAAKDEALTRRLREELQWLRRVTDPCLHAPHALRCPLTHRALREPSAAADGYTYERAALLEWLLADERGASPLSGRRLRSRRARPNLALRDVLRDPPPDSSRDPPPDGSARASPH